MKKSIDINQDEFLQSEHETIARLLAEELPEYIDNCGLKKREKESLEIFLQMTCKGRLYGFKFSQDQIAENFVLIKDQFKDRSYVSRKTDILNPILKGFCKERGISPPIQLFFYQHDSGKAKPFGCHFACSKPIVIVRKSKSGKSADRTIQCSTEIVPLEEAMKNGISEDQKSQEVLTEIREKLIAEATKELIKKLEIKKDGVIEKDYRPLGLRIGTIEKKNNEDNEQSAEKQDIHVKEQGRIWKTFNVGSLKSNFPKNYILSSDVGTGKTTFLRHLQKELLTENERIPVYIHASEIEEWKCHDYDSFEECLKTKLNLYTYENKHPGFWERTIIGKLFLLIDGLDQITGTGDAYRVFLDDLLRLADFLNIDMLVASRPTAVISAEDNEGVYFLRLMPFGIDVQKVYFGEYYIRALEICRHDSKMMGVPMLAFMIRFLIDKKQDKDIRNRKDLYKRFIDYVFIKYKHEKISISRHKRLEIRRALQNISYDALADKNINPQKIPLGFCAERVSKLGLRIEVDDLSKHGMTNFVVDNAEDDGEILFFTHQSFQEYFAAEWASESEDRINYLIENYWNPNWKEVIRFLINGKRSDDIIKRIYSDKIADNKIHSRLLIASQLASDLENESAYKHELFESLKNIVDKPFKVEALTTMIDMRTTEAQNYAWKLLKELSSGINFSEIKNILDNSKYVDTLFNEDRLKWVVENLTGIKSQLAIYVLGFWKNYIQKEHIDIVVKSSTRSYGSSWAKQMFIQKLEPDLTGKHLEYIVSLLKSASISDQKEGLYCTAYIPSRIKNKELRLIIDCLKIACYWKDPSPSVISESVMDIVAFSIANQYLPLPQSIILELLEFYWDCPNEERILGYFGEVLGNKLEQEDLYFVMDKFKEDDKFHTKAFQLLRCSRYKLEKQHLRELFQFTDSTKSFPALYWEVLARHCSCESDANFLLNRFRNEIFEDRAMIACMLFRYFKKFVRKQDIEVVLKCLDSIGFSSACEALAYVFTQLNDEQKLKTLEAFIEPFCDATYNFGEAYKFLSANFSYKHNRYVIDSIVNKDSVNKFMVYWLLINPSSLGTKDIACLEQFLEHPIPKVRNCSCKILKELHSLGKY